GRHGRQRLVAYADYVGGKGGVLAGGLAVFARSRPADFPISVRRRPISGSITPAGTPRDGPTGGAPL
ncbi:MAG TPA: hypothetical protein VIJ07_22605, partial [Dermatophilaceae bacterium]